jgi:general secretion pathway protein G
MSPQRKRFSGRPAGRFTSGFTLIELMVVLAILALLATIVGPRVIGQQDTAMRVKAQTTIASLETAVKMYKLQMGRYPTTAQGLQALVACPETEGNCEDWQKGGYLEKRTVPRDPWGNAFIYLYPGVHNDFDIVSYGADGAPGGQDENADINSWEIE